MTKGTKMQAEQSTGYSSATWWTTQRRKREEKRILTSNPIYKTLTVESVKEDVTKIKLFRMSEIEHLTTSFLPEHAWTAVILYFTEQEI